MVENEIASFWLFQNDEVINAWLYDPIEQSYSSSSVFSSPFRSKIYLLLLRSGNVHFYSVPIGYNNNYLPDDFSFYSAAGTGTGRLQVQ